MGESELLKPESPFWEYIGLTEVISENGVSEVKVDIFSELLQRRGHVHGGVIAALIDASIGSATRSVIKQHQFSATVELKTNFIRPGTGSHLVAKASIVHKGGTLAVGKSEVYDEREKLIAVGTATFIIKDKD